MVQQIQRQSSRLACKAKGQATRKFGEFFKKKFCKNNGIQIRKIYSKSDSNPFELEIL